MSRIDASGAIAKLQAARAALAPTVEAAIDAELLTCQARAVELAPKRTGNLAAVIGGPDAIEKKMDEASGMMTWRFGFITEAAKRAAWYWRFVEFGTKGYTPGQERRAGFDKRGRQKFRKIRRFIPARVAQPFMRPSIIEMRRRIEARGWWRNMATKIGKGEVP